MNMNLSNETKFFAKIVGATALGMVVGDAIVTLKNAAATGAVKVVNKVMTSKKKPEEKK